MPSIRERLNVSIVGSIGKSASRVKQGNEKGGVLMNLDVLLMPVNAGLTAPQTEQGIDCQQTYSKR